MSEKRFLSFVLTDGILLTAMSLMMLGLPKVTDISFGLVMCVVLIVYGGYKAIASFLARNFEEHYILNMANGIILFAAGILMFFAPVIDMVIIVTVLGAFLILSSISSLAFVHRTKNIFQSAKTGYIAALVRLLAGILLMLFVPTLWIGGVLLALSFLVSGIALLNMYTEKIYSA